MDHLAPQTINTRKDVKQWNAAKVLEYVNIKIEHPLTEAKTVQFKRLNISGRLFLMGRTLDIWELRGISFGSAFYLAKLVTDLDKLASHRANLDSSAEPESRADLQAWQLMDRMFTLAKEEYWTLDSLSDGTKVHRLLFPCIGVEKYRFGAFTEL